MTTISTEEFLALQAQEQSKKPKRKNKFGAKKTQVDGHTFDSRHEANRYGQLKLMQTSGAIKHLECQPPYHFVINGYALKITYTPDFRYWDCEQKRWVIEDAKSEPTKTESYRLKRELMLAVYGIVVMEV